MLRLSARDERRGPAGRGAGALPDRRGGDDVHHGGLFGISAPCARRVLLPRHRRHRAACTDVHLPGGNSGQGRSAPVRAGVSDYKAARLSISVRWSKKFLRIFMPLPDSAGGAFFRKNRALENSGKTRCRELQKFIRILLDFLHGNPENGKNCGRKRIAFRKKS